MTDTVIALSGGIGGAKLALGLSKILHIDELLIVANTADDFEHLGFTICPDIDTLLYTLGGVSNTETGWGRADETWTFMQSLMDKDPENAWFQLGDKDLETHRYRTTELARGKSLSDVTKELAQNFAVMHPVIPMSNDPVRTHMLVETGGDKNWMPFQEYFVKHRCEPRICDIEYRGRASASVTPALETALTAGNVKALVLCPSNPYLSIDPILSVRGMTRLLRRSGAPVIAVSPIVGGRALKGPTAKIMQELGKAVDVLAIAEHYRGVIGGLVIDRADLSQKNEIQAMGIEVTVTNTVMTSLDDRVQLAHDVVNFASAL